MITVITCTGHRPEAFQLCHAYLSRQTYKGPLQWIVINDAYTQEEISRIRPSFPDMELYAGPVKWQAGVNTQRFNMTEALRHVRGDKVLIMEDDEFYRPDYIEIMANLLDCADIVGEGNAKYFNLQVPGFKEMGNTLHASLCQTGITKDALPRLKLAVDSGELYFDIHLWRQVREKKIPHILIHELNLCIGIKGMPGRGNIGAGGRLKDYQYNPDLSKLKEWLGADASNYLPYIKERKYERGMYDSGRERKVLQREGSKLQPQGPGPKGNAQNDYGKTGRNLGTHQPGTNGSDLPKGNVGSKTGQ